MTHPKDADFEQVTPNDASPGKTSPELPEGPLEAIVISAPKTVRGRGRLVVSGAIRLRIGRFGESKHARLVRLVAVAPDGTAHVGPAIERRGSAWSDEGRAATALSPSTVTSFFHTDIAENLDAPRMPGLYCIHAFVGKLVSNGVLVELSEEGR